MKAEHKGRSTTPVLITILFFVVYIVWGEEIYNAIIDENVPALTSVNRPNISEDEIVSVELIDNNYWEAKFKVNYKHRTGRPAGYLTVTGEKWSPNVGLNTSAGSGSGITYLARKYAQKGSYFDTYVEARMYNPYRIDHSYAKTRFQTDIIWPGEEVLPLVHESLNNRFANVGEVVIYRNIPDYIQFAEKLTKSGFPPHKITMMLSVCPNCDGGLIYGDNVNFDELQSILEQLQLHGFSLDKVYHSTEAKHAGKIYIGNTPPKNSKPLWENFEKLTSDGIGRKEFFSILGFPQKEDWQIAIDKTEKAKRFINVAGKKNLQYARSFLDEAIKLDKTYIPAYLESARLIMRSARFNEEYPSENGKKAVLAAKKVILAALKIDPNHADAYVLLGYTETVLKEFKSAASSFNKAEALGTRNIWLLYNRGLMFKGIKNFALELAEYEKSVGVAPDGGDNDRPLKRVLNKLANLYWSSGKMEKAMTTYRALYNFFPDYYGGNASYIKAAIANGSDHENVEKIISTYKRKNWDIAYYADAMNSVMEAAQSLSSNHVFAVSSIASAQASIDDFLGVIADLSKGEKGRLAIEKLFKGGLLNMKSLEEHNSLALHVMDLQGLQPLKFALKMGANPNYAGDDYYSSPLIKAVMASNYPVIKLLLKHGADPHLKASNGYTVFDWAERYSESNIIELLNTKASI